MLEAPQQMHCKKTRALIYTFIWLGGMDTWIAGSRGFHFSYHVQTNLSVKKGII